MDELLGKKVPVSAQAEQAVIGSVLIDPDCIPSVMECLRADEFYGKLNRDIYDTVYSMFAYGMTVDPVTVLGQMRVRGVYQDNCEQYMAEVMRMTPTAANVLEYGTVLCCDVSEKQRMRSTISSMKAAEKRRPRWKPRSGKSMRFVRGEMSAD